MTPFLIGGTGRSGTTLLRQILAHAPQCAVIGQEPRFLCDHHGLFDTFEVLSRSWTPYRADTAISDFQDLLYRIARTGYNNYWLSSALPCLIAAADALPDYLGGEVSDVDWIGMDHSDFTEVPYVSSPLLAKRFRNWFDFATEGVKDGAQFFVDDTPDAFAWIGSKTVQKIFVDYIGVVVVRHPFDIYASWRNRRREGIRWLPAAPDAALSRLTSILESIVEHQPPTLRLEALCYDHDILRHWLSPFDITLPQKAYELFDAEKLHVDAWKELPPEEIVLIKHSKLHHLAKELGYHEQE